MTVQVNEVEIPDAAIAAEMQYHPSDSAEAARQAAATALVVREVLRQEARRLGVAIPSDGEAADPEDAAIDLLMEQEVKLPAPDDETCRRYYENNRRRFRTPDLFLADHILIAVPPEDREGREAAKARAADWIRDIEVDPAAMAALARQFSDCPSKFEGGNLGWVSRGQTVSEFETYLFSLEPGELCRLPVESRYGVHVLRLNRKEPGRELPIEAVREKIAAYLANAVWRRAVRQYVELLLARTRLGGIDLGDLAATPLVQ
ncbi:MAG: peptidylprolyl isomerase [Alphaproteobacteria bacterium]|nr:peptidylprolyl isomerase [Alphaproteobacteria bacterium]